MRHRTFSNPPVAEVIPFANANRHMGAPSYVRGSSEDCPMTKDALSPRQRRFVEEYLVDLNATKAAIRAGYSERTARQMAAENLSKPDIQAAIAEAQDARAQRVQISADRVIQELVAM